MNLNGERDPESMMEARSIIDFDGYCNLCSWSVNFILKRDKKARFVFTSNQSEAGKRLLSQHNICTPESVLLVEEDKCYSNTSAVFRILGHLGFPWNISLVFLVIPPALRDFVYRFISARRYRWWGRRSTCRVATKEEMEKFLP